MSKLGYQGFNFIYAGTPSLVYGLRIVSWESSDYRYPGGSNMEITTDKAARALRSNILSITPKGQLTFDVEVECTRPLNMFQAHMVKTWLFGQIKPQKLFILATELDDVYFNCVLNDPEDIIIDGNNGWKFTAVCDADGAWELPKTYSWGNETFDGSTVAWNDSLATRKSRSKLIQIKNISGHYGYVYPTVKLSVKSENNCAWIINETDNNREMDVGGRSSSASAVITIDGETKLYNTANNTGVFGFANFNKTYFRLLPGTNNLYVSNNLNYLDITYQNFRRLGG